MALVLTIRITLGNDAMQTEEDVRYAFEHSRVLGTTEPFENGEGGALRDANGNVVGGWQVAEEA